jgi:hypothetical protein
VECDEPLDVEGEKHNCRPSSDATYVEDIGYLAGQARTFVPDPSRITIGVIAGPTEPFSMNQTSIGGAPAMLRLANSCSWDEGTGGAAASPPVRLAAFAALFGSHGVKTNVCSADLSPAVDEIERIAAQMFGLACLDITKLRDESTEPGIQPGCTAIEIRDGIEAPLPRCPAPGMDCFDLVADDYACPHVQDYTRFVVNYVTPPSVNTYIRARCESL